MAILDPPPRPIDQPVSLGQNANKPQGYIAPVFQPTYASTATIQSLIQSLQASLSDLLNTLHTTLNNLALPVTDNDPTLAVAVAQAWPNSLGIAPNYVTYNYYKYLLSQNSSAATLITSAYLAAAQGVGGNDAIDLLPIVNVLNNEVNYINVFVTNNLSGGVNDTSEQRTAELFQDLLTSINTQVQNAQQIFQNQGTILSTEETQQLSSGDAQNAQALFQVNLNKLNIQLNQDLQVLQTNIGANASVFYDHFLGPALQFRQNVTSQMLPMYNGTLGALINTSVNSTNADLQQSLIDQQGRIHFLANQVDQIMRDIINRDVYRNYIVKLADRGVPIPAGLSGQMIQATDSPEALTFFQDAAAGILPPATPSFTADHNTLDNLLSLEAHPQYLTTAQYESATPAWYIPPHVIPPAITVTGPDNFGTSPQVGISLNYAREDHDHGLPNVSSSSSNILYALGFIPPPTGVSANGSAFRAYIIGKYDPINTTDSAGLTLWQIADPITGIVTYNYTFYLEFHAVARTQASPFYSAVWTTKAVAKGDGVSTYSWLGSAPVLTTVAADSATTTWTPTLSIVNIPGTPLFDFVLAHYDPYNVNVETTLILDAVAA